MIIRLGFVSTAMAIFNNTPSSTFTYKLFSERPREEALQRAIEIGRKNLQATQRILYYNAAHGIRLFRLSSALIPLATHPDVQIDVAGEYADELRKLGDFAKAHDMRLSMHPNQFTLLNGSDKVVAAAIEDLNYHAAILDGMGLDEAAIINIHVGGVYGDKEAATQKLFDNAPKVPESAMRRLTFENDDKTYTLEETLSVSQRLQRPCMLDLHSRLVQSIQPIPHRTASPDCPDMGRTADEDPCLLTQEREGISLPLGLHRARDAYSFSQKLQRD
jgi:UV DNA damage endonuclease